MPDGFGGFAPAAIVEAWGICAASHVCSSAARKGWSPSTSRASRGCSQTRAAVGSSSAVVDRLLLQSLDELQAAHEPQPLGFDLGRARPASMLRVEAADPGLVKLGGFAQEPLGRERFVAVRLHGGYRKRYPPL